MTLLASRPQLGLLLQLCESSTHRFMLLWIQAAEAS
jgi:hypothetical protein